MVDYSKWKDIEISDDEDETHPNIDTPSLFRWRHQARVERMEEMEREKEEFSKRKNSQKARLLDVKQKIKEKGETEELKKELEKVEEEGKEIARIEDELRKKEKKTPWNVDTISKPGFQKTVINTNPKKNDLSNLSEEEREKRMKNFVKENEKVLKQFGMLRKYDDSKRFLQEHHHLVCEETANYLVIWSINLEMEEKHELMSHVAHQCICMQYILELSKQLDVDPRACVGSFFSKIQNCMVEYRQQFESEIEAFKERVRKRAQEKIQEALAEQEEEERKARLGPGGLDPVEVFESLPDELKECFESRNIALLQETIAKMPEQEARYHIKRCVDSGLWLPEGGKKEGEAEEEPASASETKKEETENVETKEKEPTYTGISDDEDETHPNIDTPSLFRWRHQARVERMEEMEREKEEFSKRKNSQKARLLDVKQKIKEKGETEELKKELEKVEEEGKEIARIEDELRKKEKKTPWNVDTISKPGFQKTVINTNPKKNDLSNLSEEEREKRMKNFVKENEKVLKQFGMLRKYDDSKRFLQEHHHLVCEETANYLVIWSINLEMEEKHELMSHVAHQCICMQYILELSKQLDVDPRACVGSFFSKIQNCMVEYRQQFESEIEAFKERVRKRAQEKIQEALAEQEEEERKARLGPGGLDPVEVFESLPDELKECFESRNIALLQETIAKMPEQEARYHIKRCVDSGLWLPEGGKKEGEAEEEPASASETKKEETENVETKEKEPTYTGVSSEDLD